LKIIQIINENKYITLQEIADKIGLSRGGVKYNINKLKTEHKIVRIGSDNAGHWLIRSEIDNPHHLKELAVEEQKELVDWCKINFEKIQSFNDRYTSYGLKHIFEKDNYYITNGQFKGAMLKAGFKVKDYDELNWTFNISQKSEALKKRL
jgi:biotin operon repressor